MTRGSSHDCRNATHRANNQFTNRNRQENCRDTRVDNRYQDTGRPQKESNRFGGEGVGDNRRSDHRFNNHGSRQGRSRNGAFRGQNGQNSFQGLFSNKSGLTRVLYHEIDTGDQGPVVSRTYRYDRVKQETIDYHIEKMLKEGTNRSIQSPYASPAVLTRKNNGLSPDSPGAYRFALDYRKLNAITKYPSYPLPLIDDLITNILFIGIMSILDLKSGYFQLAISPRDIV
ncbi:retrovirus-related Pol polyprotein from transposon 17.6 [Trichonephila clavipes]|uniref:Retrovirus-related Pol polyprotein from transposon 17.6 n=1 Tax=Trichonephila clavipes TaxID=2585209 RepID=A0A8X6RIN3_TRICX|nr:retrovirus-related Pol polyprotein from transposon 17.6 [Trichonephila clavipes]